MTKIKKVELVSDESKYAYKCMKCGAELEQDDHGGSWDNISLDRMEIQHCSKCGKMFEYYYSLDCIQCEGEEKQETVLFTNSPDNDYIEIGDVTGEWKLPEEVSNDEA